jgi:hypothetical protein
MSRRRSFQVEVGSIARVPAHEIESLVCDGVRSYLEDLDGRRRNKATRHFSGGILRLPHGPSACPRKVAIPALGTPQHRAHENGYENVRREREQTRIKSDAGGAEM